MSLRMHYTLRRLPYGEFIKISMVVILVLLIYSKKSIIYFEWYNALHYHNMMAHARKCLNIVYFVDAYCSLLFADL
jgi:hypothetical protein